MTFRNPSWGAALACALAFGWASCSSDKTTSPPPGLTVTPSAVDVNAGASSDFTVSVSGVSEGDYVASSSATGVATVTHTSATTGTITGVSQGAAVIRVAVLGFAAVQDSILVTVAAPPESVPPSLTALSVPADNSVNPADTTFVFSAMDSVKLREPNPLDVKVEREYPGASGQDACPIGFGGGVCGFAAVDTSFRLPSGDGYYTVTVMAVDSVGNRSAAVVRHLLVDHTPPTVTPGYAHPPAPPAGGQPYSYTVNTVTDNLDLAWTAPRIQIDHDQASFSIGPVDTLGAFGPSELSTQNVQPITYGGTFIRGWQLTNDGGAPADTVTAPSSTNYLTEDQAGNIVNAWLDFSGGDVPAPGLASFTDRGLSAFTTTVSTDTVGRGDSFTVTATVVDTSTVAPFDVIWVYQSLPSSTPSGVETIWLTKISSAPTATDNGNGTTTWTWTSAAIPASVLDAFRVRSTGSILLRLAGVTADGYALLSPYANLALK